jgi:hypothetical protein
MKSNWTHRAIVVTSSFLFFCTSDCLRLPSMAVDKSVNQFSTSPKEPDPKRLELLLKQQFKVSPPDALLSNPFPIIVPRNSKSETLDAIDSRYQVIQVDASDCGGFFRRQQILLVTVDYDILGAGFLPGRSPKSEGMFAYDGKNLTYLNGANSKASLSSVLRCENQSLKKGNPELLAKLFAQTILCSWNKRVLVVQSPDDLSANKLNPAVTNTINPRKIFWFNWTKNMCYKSAGYSYMANSAELRKYKGQLTKPVLSGDSKNGWKLHFAAICGRDQYLDTLAVYNIFISPKFDLQVSDHTLSENIIKQVRNSKFFMPY